MRQVAPESEARFLRAVLDGVVGHAILATDGSGRIVSWSAGAERIFGYSAVEVVARADLGRLDDPDEEAPRRAAAILDAARRSGAWAGEVRRLRKDGRRFLAHVTVGALRGGLPGRGTLGFAVVFRELGEERRIHELVSLAAEDALWDWDVRSDTVVRNEAIRAIYGVTEAEIDRSLDWWRDRLHADDRDAVCASLRGALEGKKDFWSAEYRFRRPDGSTAIVHDRAYVIRDEAGRPLRMVGAVRDVTEQRRAEEALQAQTRILRSVVNSMSDGVVVCDDAGRFLLFNPAAERIAGVDYAEASPEDWTDKYGIFRPDQRTPFPAVELPLARAIRGEPCDQVELFLRNPTRPDGAIVSVSGRPLTDDQGRVTGGVVVFRDITERRRLEEELAQLQKMETVARVASGVAHDFGTLASAIRCYAGIVLDELGTGDRKRADVEQIATAADHALHLARRFMRFGRGEVAAPRVLDVHEVLATVEGLVRPLVGRRVKVSVRPLAVHPHVRADRGELEQVILNLAVNARDAMPEGGRLTIETGDAEIDAAGARKLGLESPGPYVLLRVHDTGTGMAPEVRARVFEPYFTTKGGKGTGLGLFTVYGIVRRAGGHVSVRSLPGAGATFEIVLPRAEVRLPAATTEAKAARPERRAAPKRAAAKAKPARKQRRR